VDHHQPKSMKARRITPTQTNFFAADVVRALPISDLGLLISDFLCSHGSTMRNKSIGTEIFFSSVGASFSNRASKALRIWRSTSIETQIPPAPASDSIREAMFTPSP